MISLIFSISYSVSSPALIQDVEAETRNLPFVEVDLSDFKDEVRESSTNTFDDSQSKHNLLLSLNVSVLDSQNVSEFISSLQIHSTLLTS